MHAIGHTHPLLSLFFSLFFFFFLSFLSFLFVWIKHNFNRHTTKCFAEKYVVLLGERIYSATVNGCLILCTSQYFENAHTHTHARTHARTHTHIHERQTNGQFILLMHINTQPISYHRFKNTLGGGWGWGQKEEERVIHHVLFGYRH